MDPNDTTEIAPEAMADETASPAETEGASSSDASTEGPQSVSDAIADALMEDDSPDVAEVAAEDEPEVEATAETDDEPAKADVADVEQTPETDNADDDDRIPEEEFRALPEGVRRRLGKLNSKAQKATRELGEAEAKIETMQASHDNFTQIQGFVQENRIEPQNVTMAFDAMARLSRGDAAGFLQLVQPFYDAAQRATGGTIDPSLRERVDNGYLTEDDAKALTVAQAQQQQLTARLQQEQMANQQRAQQDQVARHQQAIGTAVGEREAALRSSDPEYALKEPAVREAMNLALSGGNVPRTVEAATALVDQCYALVSKNFVKPKAPRPSPPRVTASTQTRSARQPKGVHSAIYSALSE